MCASQSSLERSLSRTGVRPEKLFLRPNFIQATELGSKKPGRFVLFIGRLTSEKGLLTLLRAFCQLRDVHLKIAGGRANRGRDAWNHQGRIAQQC